MNNEKYYKKLYYILNIIIYLKILKQKNGGTHLFKINIREREDHIQLYLNQQIKIKKKMGKIKKKMRIIKVQKKRKNYKENIRLVVMKKIKMKSKKKMIKNKLKLLKKVF